MSWRWVVENDLQYFLLLHMSDDPDPSTKLCKIKTQQAKVWISAGCIQNESEPKAVMVDGD